MSIWGPSPPPVLQIHSLRQVATGTPSHVPLRCCGINTHFSRFWDQLYGPFRLGLGTELCLWSQFHILFNWRISNFVGWWGMHSKFFAYTHEGVVELERKKVVVDKLAGLGQGARSTSNENAGIPQWSVGCRNHRISRIPQILPESRSTKIQRWAIICGTRFLVLEISNNLDTNLPWQKSLCGIQEGSVGFLGFGDSDNPQTTVGFLHFRLKSIGPPVGVFLVQSGRFLIVQKFFYLNLGSNIWIIDFGATYLSLDFGAICVDSGVNMVFSKGMGASSRKNWRFSN